MSEFSTRLKMSDKMADVILKSRDYIYTLLEGSAQCGKSCAAALAFALIIENSPKEDNLFIALGYTQSSAINNIFSCAGFGLMYYFGGRCKMEKYKGPDGKLKTAIDCLSIKTRNGIKIVVPFGTNTKTANNAWHGWRVAGFCIDELDRACKESIDEAKQRITTIENPHIIMTMNPPHPTHPICSWIEELEERDLINYSRWTLDDNVALTPEKVQNIKSQYDPTSEYYLRYIQGERCGSEGLVYKLYDYSVFDEFDPKEYISYIITCDPGSGPSATAFICLAMRHGFKGLDVIAEYRHRNDDKQNKMNPKQPIDYANDLAQFALSCCDLFNKFPAAIIIDDGSAFYRDCKKVFQSSKLKNINIKYPYKEEISERIKQSTSLIYQGRLRFHKRCKETISSFKSVQYDPKQYEKGIIKYWDEPTLGTRCDEVDATLYGVYYYIKDLQRVNYNINTQGG